MAEVTRVPLQPVRKGAMIKLWLGVVLLVAAGVALAWYTVPAGVSVTTITEGTGAFPKKDDVVLVNYVGKLPDGTVFDQQQGAPLELATMIPGFREGLMQMKKGGKYTLVIPSEMAYGAEGGGPIPPNSDLTFEIDLIDHISQAEYQQRMQIMQQLQQMQGQGGAEGGAAPEGAAPEGGPPQ